MVAHHSGQISMDLHVHACLTFGQTNFLHEERKVGPSAIVPDSNCNFSSNVPYLRLQLTALTTELRNIAKILPDATPLKFTKWAVSLVLKHFSKFCSVISVTAFARRHRENCKNWISERENSIFGEIESHPIKAGFHKVKARLFL